MSRAERRSSDGRGAASVVVLAAIFTAGCGAVRSAPAQGGTDRKVAETAACAPAIARAHAALAAASDTAPGAAAAAFAAHAAAMHEYHSCLANAAAR